jgi:hypothetical protein
MTGSGSPALWVACPAPAAPCDHVHIHTTIPNNGVNIIITYCNGATILNQGNTMTDANGNGDFAFNAPTGSGQATIALQAQSGVSTSFKWNCA